MFALALALAVASVCPVENAHYTLHHQHDVTLSFQPIAQSRDWPSGVAMAVHVASSGNTNYFLPWQGGSDGKENVAHTTDVTRPDFQLPSPDGIYRHRCQLRDYRPRPHARGPGPGPHPALGIELFVMARGRGRQGLLRLRWLPGDALRLSGRYPFPGPAVRPGRAGGRSPNSRDWSSSSDRPASGDRGPGAWRCVCRNAVTRRATP
jgi:hypothetical protein